MTSLPGQTSKHQKLPLRARETSLSRSSLRILGSGELGRPGSLAVARPSPGGQGQDNSLLPHPEGRSLGTPALRTPGHLARSVCERRPLELCNGTLLLEPQPRSTAPCRVSSALGLEVGSPGKGAGQHPGFSENWRVSVHARRPALRAVFSGRGIAKGDSVLLAGPLTAFRSSLRTSVCVLAWQALTYCFDCYRPAVKGLIVGAWR